jgi:hypothetical protein
MTDILTPAFIVSVLAAAVAAGSFSMPIDPTVPEN